MSARAGSHHSAAAPRTIPLALARRLALARQHLAGPRPGADRASLLRLVEDLGCVQLDPTSAVERSDALVLGSRIGRFDRAELDALLWEERSLFEYWAHAASIVVTADYGIHEATLMRTHGRGESDWERRLREWLEANDKLRRHVLDELRERGPLRQRDFTETVAVPWRATGWTHGQSVTRMLATLWTQGEILVAGRTTQGRLWDLRERVLPSETLAAPPLGEREAVTRAAERALRALGVATPKQIGRHFTRSRYPGLGDVLAELEEAGRVLPVEVTDDGAPLRGRWLLHADDVPLLERLEGGWWEPRTTLLSPFDNLICDRERTQQLFGFDFRLEIYVPRAQRWGFFVMPVLAGDRLVARVDPTYDRRSGILTVKAVQEEEGAEGAHEAVERGLEDLARLVGAGSVVYADGRRGRAATSRARPEPAPRARARER